MFGVVLLITTALLFQSAVCEVRDQRYIQQKLRIVGNILAAARKDLDLLDPSNVEEKQVLYAAAEDFSTRLTESVNRLDQGVINNTRDNEQGKVLYKVAREAREFTQWVQTHLNDKGQILQSNFKSSLDGVGKLVPIVSNALGHVKESTHDDGLAVNSVLSSTDNSLFLFTNLYYHLKYKKYSNSQLSANINDALKDAFKVLNRIPQKRYNTKELVIHANQLNYLLGLLIDNLDNRIKHSKETDLNPIEQATTELRKLKKSIQIPDETKVSMATLKGLYTNWLSGLYKHITKMEDAATGDSGDAVRAALFDTVGIVMFYKTIFEVVSEHA